MSSIYRHIKHEKRSIFELVMAMLGVPPYGGRYLRMEALQKKALVSLYYIFELQTF